MAKQRRARRGAGPASRSVATRRQRRPCHLRSEERVRRRRREEKKTNPETTDEKEPKKREEDFGSRTHLIEALPDDVWLAEVSKIGDEEIQVVLKGRIRMEELFCWTASKYFRASPEAPEREGEGGRERERYEKKQTNKQNSSPCLVADEGREVVVAEEHNRLPLLELPMQVRQAPPRKLRRRFAVEASQNIACETDGVNRKKKKKEKKQKRKPKKKTRAW